MNRYDAWQLKYLADHLKPGQSALDIGAHHGQDSLVMAALCGRHGEVSAFEPSAEARAVFMRNLALNPQVKPPTLLPFAVSDQDGHAVLFAEAGVSANSSLTPTGTTAGAVPQYEVQTIKLDTWMTRVPNLVKIDVEGYEIRILAGARRLLDSPAAILCELHPYAWPAIGDSYEGLCDLLAQHGRRVRYLDDHDPAQLQYGIALLERR